MQRKWLILAPGALLAVGLLGCGGGEEPAATETAEAPAETAQMEYTEIDPATTGTLKGVVKFEGEAPARRPLTNIQTDPECAEMHDSPPLSETVVVNENGTLRNVALFVSDGLEANYRPAPQAVEIDQVGCVYTPHVVVVQVGQTLRVKNSDPTTHNVHPLPEFNPESNQSQRPNASDDIVYQKEELMLPVKCNIHPWMRAYVNVVDNPFFAVTGDDGSFEISGIPAGTYTFTAAHEKYENQDQSITITAGETAEIEFTFSE